MPQLLGYDKMKYQPIEITLNLKRHCIKTGTKKIYESLINDYFKGLYADDNEKIIVENKIEALKFFLEHGDFIRIRSANHELSGADELVIAKLIIPKNLYDIKIFFNEKIIKPDWKK
jgi:hypothetical protein